MLEKPKFFLTKALETGKFLEFWIFGEFEAYCRASAGPKSPITGQKRVLGITLARGGVAGRMTPLFPCTLRVPNHFRRVRDANGTIWTTFGPPGGPAGPARAGSEKFFGRGSRGSENFFPPRIFFYKNVIHWVLSGFRAQKTHFGPL